MTDFERLYQELLDLPVSRSITLDLTEQLVDRKAVLEIASKYRPLSLSDVNRALIYSAYDDGDGSTVCLRLGSHGYFVGEYDGDTVYEGVEIEGVLYSIVAQSCAGRVTVLVGRELVENDVHRPIFDTRDEARAYIKGLVAK